MKKFILVFISILTFCLMSITSFASTTDGTYDYNGTVLAKVPDGYDDGYWYLVKKVSTTYLFYTTKPLIADGSNIRADGGTSYVQFSYYLGAWGKYYESSIPADSYSNIFGGSDTIIWSSSNIYTTSGLVYFNGDPNFFTLAERVRLLVGETLLEVTVPRMAGTMKILVLCGVGLMASLVLLKLFGKRLLIFRR